jgi:hypothetical protein
LSILEREEDTANEHEGPYSEEVDWITPRGEEWLARKLRAAIADFAETEILILCDSLRGWALRDSAAWAGRDTNDGVYPIYDFDAEPLRSPSLGEIELRGTVWFLGKCSSGETPLWLRAKVNSSADRFDWFDIRLGDADRGMYQSPSGRSRRTGEWLRPRQWLFHFWRGRPSDV